MNRFAWCELLPGWVVDGDIGRGFFLTEDLIPPGKRVVEVPISGLFVRDLPAYVEQHRLAPASTGQAIEYARTDKQAQLDRVLIIVGNGGVANDAHGNSRALSLTCIVGQPAIDIRQAPERIGPQSRLLVLA